MATPRKERAYEKYAWILIFASGIVLLRETFELLFSGRPPLSDRTIEPIAGMSWSQLFSQSPGIASLITFTTRMGVIFILSFAILAISVSLTGYRRGERWTWYALWILPLSQTFVLALVSSFIGQPAIRIGVSTPNVVIVLSLLGLLLPVRKFFPKKQ